MTAPLLLPIVAVLIAAPPESPDDQAKALFQEGVALAKEEQWTDALERFEASRALVDRPSTTFNIGTTLMHLGRPVAAAREFRAFIEREQDPTRVEAAQTLLDDAEAKIAHLFLQITPREAVVLVDEEPTDQRKLALDPGTHAIRVEAEGHEPVALQLELVSGANKQTVSLEPIAAPPPPPPPPPVAVVPPPPPVEPPGDDASILESPWFWVVTGIVVVGTAVGVGVAVSTGTPEPYGGTGNGVIRP